MSDKPKDMNYYLAHPDEMPTDPKIIEQLAEDMRTATMNSGQEEVSVDRFSVTDPVAKDERTGASSDAEAAKKEADAKALAESNAKTEADAAAKAVADAALEKPEGVLAKDGKNIIPFAVLSNARERADAAERLVQEQAAQLEELKAAAKTGKPVVEQQAEILSEDELNALAEDSPTLAKVLRAQQNTIQQLTGTVESLAQRSQAQEQVAQAEVKTEVQSAIDANPTLLAWQNEKDQTTWDKASSFDKLLRESPEYRDVPFAERFIKVVALTKVALDLKDEQVDQNDKTLSQAEIRAAAEAKLKTTKALPTSLSQIPGGAPPAVDEKERVDQASPVELGQKFMGMKSVEEINAYLSTL